MRKRTQSAVRARQCGGARGGPALPSAGWITWLGPQEDSCYTARRLERTTRVLCPLVVDVGQN